MGSPRDYYETFTGAGTREIRARGRHLRILEAPAAVVFVSLDGSSELERRAGQGINFGTFFDRITIRSAVAQTVQVCVSDERQDDDQESVSVTVSATLTPGNTLGAGGDVAIPGASAAVVIAADADRLAVTIVNPVTNTDPVRVGGLGVGAAAGIELYPSDSYTLATTDAVYVYNGKASAQTVQVLPLRNV